MKMKNILKSMLCTVLCAAMFSACAQNTPPVLSDSSVNLTAHLKANAVTGKTADKAFVDSQYEFSVELFKRVCAESDGSVLVSPVSVMLALAMTANGADGETLKEMEDVLGMDIDELNKYLYEAYIKGKKDDKVLSIADSIWIRDIEALHVNDEFLQTDKDYYDAEVYKAPFDQTTVDDINKWCDAHTNGMIKKILDEIGDDEIMHLINAVCFVGEWQEEYKKSSVRDAEFTKADGTKQNVKMMYSTEEYYYKYGGAKGFKKPYKNGYSFVAMLPDKGTDISEFCAGLSGEYVSAFLESGQSAKVETGLPKFTLDFNVNLNDTLKAMGMPSAFDGAAADFSKLGHSDRGNIRIGYVNHFTHIEVDEKGTKAAAITDVMLEDRCVMYQNEVILDRPFVYMIIDDATELPVFIGVAESIE